MLTNDLHKKVNKCLLKQNQIFIILDLKELKQLICQFILNECLVNALV